MLYGDLDSKPIGITGEYSFISASKDIFKHNCTRVSTTTVLSDTEHTPVHIFYVEI